MKVTNIVYSLILLIAPKIGAEQVIWPSDDWAGLTHSPKDLYWTLFQRAFDNQGFKLQRQNVPFKRAIKMVEEHKADLAGGVNKYISESTLTIQAPFPVSSTPISTFYKRSFFPEAPPTAEDLSTLRGVSTHQIGDNLVTGQLTEVGKKTQAFDMVIRGRADYYIDYAEQIEFELNNKSGKVSSFKESDYTTSIVSSTNWYMIFPRNDRGKKILNAYIKGTQSLYNSGELERIYQARGFTLPPKVKLYFDNFSNQGLK